MELEKILEENNFIVAAGILVILQFLLIITAPTYPEEGVGILPP